MSDLKNEPPVTHLSQEMKYWEMECALIDISHYASLAKGEVGSTIRYCQDVADRALKLSRLPSTPPIAEDPDLEALALSLAPKLPANVTVRVLSPIGLAFKHGREDFWMVSWENKKWRGGGFRQHGLGGHPQTNDLLKVLKENGLDG